MSDFAERITRDLTVRYVAVLAMVGALAIASFLGLARLLAQADDGAQLLNVAGRQRMLVERATRTAQRLAVLPREANEARTQAQALLSDALDGLEGSHMGLLAGLPEHGGRLKPSPEVGALYFAGDGVDARLRAFIEDGRDVLRRSALGPIRSDDKRIDSMTSAAEGALLDGLDAIARRYQKEARDRLTTLSTLLGGVVLALLLVLMGAAVVVFRPMTRRIRHTMAQQFRAEKELRESEERLWRILDESPIGVSVSRRSDGVVVFANNRFCDIIGAPKTEVVGAHARDHYVDDAQRGAVVRLLKERGRLDDFEAEFRRRDGSPFPSLLTLRTVRLQSETLNLAWVYDVTAIKRTQEQLRLVAKVVETASEAVCITNGRNEVEFVNPAFTTITEYTPEDIVGRNPKILQSGRHDDDFYRAMWRTLAECGRWQGEIWNRRKSGEFYAEWLSIVAIKDDSGTATHHIAVFSDITHRKEDEARVWRQANYDALTGLPNRSLFLDRLAQAVRQNTRDGKAFAVMFLDLDGFKAVNDTLGHAAGDDLLQQTAARLTECMRASDTVARLAGDEFTVILEGIQGRTDVATVADKILDALARPFDIQGRTAEVRGSIGIALFPDDATDGPTLLALADKAMYGVKKAGKNAARFSATT